MTGMTKCDPPKGGGVWKLHTPDLRLFGWPPTQNALILAAGEFKRALKGRGSPTYVELGKQVVNKRKQLRLGEALYGEIYSIFPRAR